MYNIPYFIISKNKKIYYPNLVMEEIREFQKKRITGLIILFDMIQIYLIMCFFYTNELIMAIALFSFCIQLFLNIQKMDSLHYNEITRKEIDSQLKKLKNHELIHCYLANLFNFQYAIIIIKYNTSRNYSCSGITLLTGGSFSIFNRILFTILNFFFDLVSYFYMDIQGKSLEPFYLMFKNLIKECFEEIRFATIQDPITIFQNNQEIKDYASYESNIEFKKLDFQFKDQ